MEEGLIAEVEQEIRDYEAFLRCPDGSQGRASASAPTPPGKLAPGVTTQTPSDTDRHPLAETYGVGTSSFAEELDRILLLEEEKTAVESRPEERKRPESETLQSMSENPSQANREVLDERKVRTGYQLGTSDEEDFCQIFDDALAIHRSADDDFSRRPAPTAFVATAQNDRLGDADSMRSALNPASAAARPQQQWIDYKTGQLPADSASGTSSTRRVDAAERLNTGPEEITCSSYSQVGGSSRADTAPIASRVRTQVQVVPRHGAPLDMILGAIQDGPEKQTFERCSPEISRKRKEAGAHFSPSPRRAATASTINASAKQAEYAAWSTGSDFLEKHEVEKGIREAADLAECSFRPRTGRPPRTLIVQQPVEDRLYHALDGKSSAMARCLMKREQEILTECTFRPITNNKPPRSYVPLQERATEIQLSKRERLHNRTDDGMTFSPAINPRSKKLAIKKEKRQLRVAATDGTCVVSSPHDCNAKTLPRDSPTESDDLARAFSARINRTSERLLRRLNVPEDFMARQAYFDTLRKRKQQAMQYERDQEECTFVPRTANSEDVLAASKFAGRLFEDREEFIERLAHKDLETRELNRAITRDNEMARFTFRPEIDAISKRIGRGHTVEELYEEGKRKLTRSSNDTADSPGKECTFRPRLAKPSPKYLRDKGAEAEVEARLWKRAQVTAEINAQRMRDMQDRAIRAELKECTFTPNIKHHVSKASGPVAIAGLGRYLELRQSARRMKDDQKRREEEIFRLKAEGPFHKFTVPEPFNLTETSAKPTPS